MDLQQRKLTKEEWDSTERPVNSDELRIINMIIDGFHDVNIKRNTTMTILQYLKVANSDAIDKYVFVKYLQNELKKALSYSKKAPLIYEDIIEKKGMIKKSDTMRFEHTDAQLPTVRDTLFEFVMIDILKMTMKSREKKGPWQVGYYTLYSMSTYSVERCNSAFREKINNIISQLQNEINVVDLVYNGQDLIEYNKLLLKYADEELYEHQKRLFTTFKNAIEPQLVLYIAPTGTGKTMSPLGLLGGKKVIYVCAARHVGLALAKSAISSGKKLAFAFGCNDAEDIRLHYSAAKEFTKNTKTGGIYKVDNSVGDNVELMICDIKSYIPAMLYMCAFNDPNDMITYWDEPTITMDYDNHECHNIIKMNWAENKIPNMVLSSATLPQESEMAETIMDFKSRFENAQVTSIVSHDCKKTIPLMNRNGEVEMPHFLFGEDYKSVVECAKHCENYLTLLRYIDLGQSIQFIKLVNKKYKDAITQRRFHITRQFIDISDVNMSNIKIYYLKLLQNIKPECWNEIYNVLLEKRKTKYNSTVYVSTNDANTLTDGPTIYLADDVNKIAKFCIQTSKIPEEVLREIDLAMKHNNIINSKVSVLTKSLEDLTAADEDKDRKMSNDNRGSQEVKDLRKKIDELNSCVKLVSVPDMYIPNMTEHLKRFVDITELSTQPFKPNVSQDYVEKIMLIDDIEDIWKLLLMIGIGVFAAHDSIRYTEIMKQLAQEQKLYLIIASTDYIYGTNYQFCHGYIGKDLIEMSQEKAIQAMGRVGRNKLQYDYSIRFRDDDIIIKLFTHDSNKPEVINMAKLFNT